jgi:hypothetical protein
MRIVPPLIEHRVLFIALLSLAFVASVMTFQRPRSLFYAYTYCKNTEAILWLNDPQLQAAHSGIEVSAFDKSGSVYIIKGYGNSTSNATRKLKAFIGDAIQWQKTLSFESVRTSMVSFEGYSVMDFLSKFFVYSLFAVAGVLVWANRIPWFYEDSDYSEIKEY